MDLNKLAKLKKEAGLVETNLKTGKSRKIAMFGFDFPETKEEKQKRKRREKYRDVGTVAGAGASATLGVKATKFFKGGKKLSSKVGAGLGGALFGAVKGRELGNKVIKKIEKSNELKKQAGLFPSKMINSKSVGNKIISSNIGKIKRGTLGQTASYNPGTMKSNVKMPSIKPMKVV